MTKLRGAVSLLSGSLSAEASRRGFLRSRVGLCRSEPMRATATMRVQAVGSQAGRYGRRHPLGSKTRLAADVRGRTPGLSHDRGCVSLPSLSPRAGVVSRERGTEYGCPGAQKAYTDAGEGPRRFPWPGAPSPSPALSAAPSAASGQEITAPERLAASRTQEAASSDWALQMVYRQAGKRRARCARTFVLPMVISDRNVRGLPTATPMQGVAACLGCSSRARWGGAPGLCPLQQSRGAARRPCSNGVRSAGAGQRALVPVWRDGSRSWSGDLAVSVENLTASKLHNGSQPPGGPKAASELQDGCRRASRRRGGRSYDPGAGTYLSG